MLKWSLGGGAGGAGAPSGTGLAMDPPAPRLCHLKKWEHFQGYGFNLHTDKTKEGQLVGNVDPGSPAIAAGVKKGDRIVEVNGTNIANENHTQVVARIKAGGAETRILVADRECVEWHAREDTIISSSLHYVIHLSSEKKPDIVPSSSSSSSDEEEEEEKPKPVAVEVEVQRTQSATVGPIVEEEEEEEKPVGRRSPSPPPATAPMAETSSSSSSEDEEAEPVQPASPLPPVVGRSPSPQLPPSTREEASSSSASEEEEEVPRPPSAPLVRRQASSSSESSHEEVARRSYGKQASRVSMASRTSTTSYAKGELVAGLNLNMTAAEMRERVGRNKKADPRHDKIDLKKKAEMIKNM